MSSDFSWMPNVAIHPMARGPLFWHLFVKIGLQPCVKLTQYFMLKSVLHLLQLARTTDVRRLLRKAAPGM